MSMFLTHPNFARGALAVGLLPGVTSLNVILRPEAALRGMGFPVPADPEARNLTRWLTRVIGVRNVMISFLLTLTWRKGDGQTMAFGLTTVLGMAVMDGFVSRAICGGGEINHWPFAPPIAGVIAGLLGLFNKVDCCSR